MPGWGAIAWPNAGSDGRGLVEKGVGDLDLFDPVSGGTLSVYDTGVTVVGQEHLLDCHEYDDEDIEQPECRVYRYFGPI